MHFPLFVITDRKPSMEMLESLLQPLRGEVEEGGRFDCWALGGRYTGQVIPYDLADTVTGGPDVGDDELAILRELAGCWNVDLSPPVSKPGTGVDVARFDNIKTLEIVPDAILINDEWHRNGSELANLKHLERFPDCREQVEALLRGPEMEQWVEAEKVMLSTWDRRRRNLLDRQAPTAWLAVIDCHF